jgi:hypothetical protein
MKPVVPSTVPYPDMRGWQRPGVKLRRQRSHRVIGTCGREAKRKLDLAGNVGRDRQLGGIISPDDRFRAASLSLRAAD